MCVLSSHTCPGIRQSDPHLYSSPFPWPLGRKAVLHDIFEPFLWVSGGCRSKHTLKYSIYWSYNLTLNWKAYFSNFSIILGQLSGAPTYSRHEQICQFPNANYGAFILSLWLVCWLGHPLFRAGHVCIRNKCGIRENELEFMFGEIFGFSLWKIWCKTPELKIHPSLWLLFGFLHKFSGRDVMKCQHSVSYENSSSRWTNRVAPD